MPGFFGNLVCTNVFRKSVHVSDIFMLLMYSLFYIKLYKNKLFLGGSYILGDNAYPCLECLMVPYRNNGHLTRAQRHFNNKLSSCRVVIENAFDCLKQRFRQYHFKYCTYSTNNTCLLRFTQFGKYTRFRITGASTSR